MSGIEAEHYGETRRRLQADPIIREMARTVGVTNIHELVHDGGMPRFEFMNGALREYLRRGGQVPTHIGGPAEAILALLNETEETL